MFWAPLGPQTVFRGILELPPGHFLVADTRSVRVEKYWEHHFPAGNDPPAKEWPSVNSVVEEFRALLIDACRIRLRADVPVGAYLSGGIDSSTIAAIVRRHTSNRLATFSIAFNDENFDESPYQEEMAAHLGTDHHILRATHEDIGRVFPDVIWHTELPIMRTAPAPMFLLSRLVRGNGFKVVLTGEGADEVLAGYDIFRENKIRRFWARQPESKVRPLLLKRLYSDIPGLTEGNLDFLSAFFRRSLTEIESPWYSHAVRWNNNHRTHRFLQSGHAANQSAFLEGLTARLPRDFQAWAPLAKAQYLESTIFLSQYLLSSQGDRMGMAHSIEGRFPFLDVRLTEFCNNLDPAWKLKGLTEKFLLKEASQPWLPDTIRQRRKRAYRAPIHRSLFNRSTADYVGELLSPAGLKGSNLFKPEAVGQLITKVRAGLRLGETDEMALAGITSTQLVHHLFVKKFSRPAPISDSERVKVCRMTNRMQSAISAGFKVGSAFSALNSP